MKLTNTKSAFLALLAALALLLLSAGCGGGGSGGAQKEEEQEQESASPVSGEFVGEAPDANDAFLALVAEAPEQGEQTREVRAYLCDGQAISEWFVGQASANDFELSSEGGARPATGIEGFYPVTVTPEGLISSTSWRGARLEGQRVVVRRCWIGHRICCSPKNFPKNFLI